MLNILVSTRVIDLMLGQSAEPDVSSDDGYQLDKVYCHQEKTGFVLSTKILP